MGGDARVIQSSGTYGTHEGNELPRADVPGCSCAHHELFRRIDAIDEKLEHLVSERRRSQKALLSMREAARRLGVDRATTLADLVRHGRIKVVMKNTRPAIPANEIDRIAREGFTTAAPAPKQTGRRRASKANGKPGDSIRELTL